MTTARSRRIRYADVAATLALAIALSTGGAFAAGQIGSNDIAKNAIKSKHIAKGQVKGADLKDNAVTGAKVKDGALSGADVADGSLAGTDLAAQVAGVAMAGVSISSTGVANLSFNRVGGAVTTSRTSEGTYSVTIPGTSFNGFSSAIVSVDGGTGAYCYLNDATGSTLQIRCRDHDEAVQDTNVSFVLYRDQTGATAPRSGSRATADGS